MESSVEVLQVVTPKPKARPKAQARPGPDFGNLGTWKSRNLGSKKIKKMKSLKIQIRSAQNVGKVWIRRRKSSWPHLGPFQAIFSMDRKKCTKIHKICKLSLVGQWALFTRFGFMCWCHFNKLNTFQIEQ